MNKRKTTHFGITNIYPGQKPEDVFTPDELAEWAKRNGWREPAKVEKFGGGK